MTALLDRLTALLELSLTNKVRGMACASFFISACAIVNIICLTGRTFLFFERLKLSPVTFRWDFSPPWLPS